MSAHPYHGLPAESFWRPAVAEADPAAPGALARPKFRLPSGAQIVTAGSCFAQHVGRALRGAGLAVRDAEPAPPRLPPDLAAAHGFGQFSARHGNIYTTRQLRQLLAEALADDPAPAEVWPDGDGFVDALRPTVARYAAPVEVVAARRLHLAALRRAYAGASHLVFTLGLTEFWEDRATGRAYPVCPGVAGGRFDPDRHRLARLSWPELMDDLAAVRTLAQRLAPGLRIILTVSPVPLTATATGAHVLVATTRAKAALRTAAADFADAWADVDYFPAYEIVTHPAAQGRFFAPNLRDVRPEGVAAVMAAFLAAHGLADAPQAAPVRAPEDGPADVACDERLLDAFARRDGAGA